MTARKQIVSVNIREKCKRIQPEWFCAIDAGLARGYLVSAVLMLGIACALGGDAPTAASYSNNFLSTPAGKPPDDMMILNGAFSIALFENTKCLELASDPLDGDGLLFGPAGLTSADISARIWADASGRRFPEFGIGCNDAGGYKLIVCPSQGIVELRHGEDAIASSPFSWKPATWTKLRLAVNKQPSGKYQVIGKAWADGSAEPKQWMISIEESEAPPAGRASIWGMPYSEKPIRFTDLGCSAK